MKIPKIPTRVKAWFRTLVQFFILMVAILIWDRIRGAEMDVQDHINLILGIISFHLLTDKYEKEILDKKRESDCIDDILDGE